eukprot:GHVR01000751.1.p1 GENE.GHVR01000751.1~~GHVR01000751.1.p1  ORF type:complete len:243 (-),score=53.86 GHVR01000751.1:140-868(-)
MFACCAKQSSVDQANEILVPQVEHCATQGYSVDETANDPQTSGHTESKDKPELANGAEERPAAVSDLSSDSPSSKERKKNLLKQIVRQFCQDASTGVPVQYIDTPTRLQRSAVLRLYREEKVFVVKDIKTHREEEWKLSSVRKHFKDVPSIVRCVESFQSLPTLLDHACALVDEKDRVLILNFKTADERDKFFYVMKVLCLLVDWKHQSKSSQSNPNSEKTTHTHTKDKRSHTREKDHRGRT